jgi:hypothetical protein
VVGSGKERYMSTISDLKTSTAALKGLWKDRNSKFKVWYDLLSMKDDLAQDNMESFVSNNPRTAYNLALHLLTSSPIPHRVSNENLGDEYLAPASELENFIELTAWQDIYSSFRKRGRQSWLRNLTGLLLATGWYSVLAMAVHDQNTNTDKCIADVWNPAEVYPRWNDNGLLECAHIYPIDALSLKNKAALNGWNIKSIPTMGSSELNDYWFIDGTNVMHTIFVGDNELVPLAADPNFTEIPIFVGPVGGLPDNGSINSDVKWQETIGQSIVATNENIYRSYNKHWTFAQQLLRDTAQPRWFEQSRTGNILKEKDLNKRGAIFRGAPEDKISTITMPALPIELRSNAIDMESMLQRGEPPWALYGTAQAQMSAYVMSQIAASTEQIIGSYHEDLIGLLTDIDNLWYSMIRDKNFSPYGFKLPKLPDGIKLSAQYEIQIPGEIIQKATVSRMLNPAFELSTTTIMETLWHEIKNPIREQARLGKDKSDMSAESIAIRQIGAYRRQAAILRSAKDPSADLYDKAAKSLEDKLLASFGQTGQANAPTPNNQSNMPPEATALQSPESLGMGTGAPQAPRQPPSALPPSQTQPPAPQPNQYQQGGIV